MENVFLTHFSNTVIIVDAVPGNIRIADHFVSFLKRFVEYIKVLSFCLNYNDFALFYEFNRNF